MSRGTCRNLQLLVKKKNRFLFLKKVMINEFLESGAVNKLISLSYTFLKNIYQTTFVQNIFSKQ